MYVCMHVCMYACMHGCMHGRMHVCTFAWMHVCMCAGVRACKNCTHAHLHKLRLSTSLALGTRCFGLLIFGCPNPFHPSGISGFQGSGVALFGAWRFKFRARV